MITSIGGAASITNGISRALWGIICEIYGPKKCVLFITLLETFTVVTIPYTPNIYAYGVSIVLMQICHGGLIICTASLILT